MKFPFKAWQCVVLVADDPKQAPSREIEGAVVCPSLSQDEEGFTFTSVDYADMFLPVGSQPPAPNGRVLVPQGHPMAGRYQLEGRAMPWPKGWQVRLRRVKNG